MATVDLARLIVTLSADSSEFREALLRASGQVNSFSSGAARATKIATAAFIGMGAATGAALAALTKSSINTADQMLKMSQKIGVPIAELQKLSFAASLSDVSMESMATAAGRLSKNMLDASMNTGEARKAFETLGINVAFADGTLRSSTAVMGDIADRFAKMQDGSQKTALALQIFGRSGADLIPLLNQGRDGIGAMAREAEKLGLVVSMKTAVSAEQFNDNLTRLGGAVRGIGNLLAAEFLPALVTITENLLNFIRTNDVVPRVFAAVRDSVYFTVEAVSGLSRAVDNIVNGAFNGLKIVLTSLRLQFVDPLAISFAGLASAVTSAATGEFRAALDTIKSIPEAIAENETSALAQLKASQVTHLNEMVQTSRAAFNQQTEDYKRNLKTQAALSQKTTETITRSQKFSFSSLASDLMGINSALFGNNKAAAIANAVINTAQGVTKALSAYPPPLSFAMAAAQAAAGLAQINAIKSANIGGGGGGVVNTGGVAGAASAAAEPQGQAAPSVVVRFGGDDDDLISRRSVRRLIENINREFKNGARIMVGA